VALTLLDQSLVQRCLDHKPGAWSDFVDRFLGLIYHVIQHTSYLRSASLRPEDAEDVAADVLLQIIANDYAVLRQFRGESSLASYLTVVARRACTHELIKRSAQHEVQAADGAADHQKHHGHQAEIGIESLEEVQKLLRKLPSRERDVVRLSYLEGRSYEEISTELNIPVNSIGPILSRARNRLRKDVIAAPPKRLVRREAEHFGR
jgi:RNA polymerase sigma-70 factor (ECF subfamily)